MTNVLALGLLLASLITSGVLSPTQEKQKNSGEDVIVKEGHRVVVVEFEKDYGSTKISISPHDSHATYDQVYENAKEKLSEKMENGKLKLIKEDQIRRGFSPKELVCDVYGKCKRKIESTMGKTKEAAAEEVHEVDEEAREAMSEAVGKVKGMASDAAYWSSGKAREADERAKDAAYKDSDKAREAKESVKDAASEATSKAKDMLGEKVGEIEEGEKEGAEEMMKNASKRAQKGAHEVKEEGKKELSDILRRAREVAFDLFEYAMPFNALHLLGFAAAYNYKMCVWVTFASSYVLASALPRHQFGIVQSKIYPVYFKAMAYSVGMALLGHLMSNQTNRKASPNNIGAGIQGFNLVMSIVMILVNFLYLQPRATKVRTKEEKEEGRGKETETAGRSVSSTATQEMPAAKPETLEIMRKCQMLNSCSSFLNFMILMSLTCHLFHLGRRLHTSC